jgi:hypothetical protein
MKTEKEIKAEINAVCRGRGLDHPEGYHYVRGLMWVLEKKRDN